MNTTKYHLSFIERMLVDMEARLEAAFPGHPAFSGLQGNLIAEIEAVHKTITAEELKGNSSAARTLKRIGLSGLNQPVDLFQQAEERRLAGETLADIAYVSKSVKKLLIGISLTDEKRQELPLYYNLATFIDDKMRPGLYRSAQYGSHYRLCLYLQFVTPNGVLHHVLLEFNTTTTSGYVVFDSYYASDFFIVTDLPWEDGNTYPHRYWELLTLLNVDKLMKGSQLIIDGQFNNNSQP